MLEQCRSARDRRQGVAELVCQGCQEFVLLSVGGAQALLADTE